MRREQGFTLIELLVVIAIVGILSTIAIYQFAVYKRQTFCASVEIDVRNTVTAEEAYFTTYQTYGATPVITLHGSAANTIVTSGMNAGMTGTVIGSSTNCVQPDGKTTFTFYQATGQYSWS